MKTRKHSWFNTQTLKPEFGFQVLHEGTWMNAMKDDGACIYKSEEECENAMNEFKD